jgi:hypothetical protein
MSPRAQSRSRGQVIWSKDTKLLDLFVVAECEEAKFKVSLPYPGTQGQQAWEPI